MKYSDMTVDDPSRLKRFIQRRRFSDAVSILKRLAGLKENASVLDYGAGDGLLASILSRKYPKMQITCYEPWDAIRDQAEGNLADLSNVSVTGTLPAGRYDVIFCNEVFEHLPRKESDEAIANLSRLLAEEGALIVGVPVEIGLPALVKGLFRMGRRFGAYDANVKNVFVSFLGNVPAIRPVHEIKPGFSYHLEHMGFDYRNLASRLDKVFLQDELIGSPFRFLPAWLNSEVYMVWRREK